MDVGFLLGFLEAIPSQGVAISQIERVKIECALRLLQNQMKAEAMFFFWKALGINNDYYLAFSTAVDKYVPSSFYCSQDCVTWFSLTNLPLDLREEAIQVTVPFTGSLISEVTLPSGAIVSEEQRLAAMVHDIFDNCILIPRGVILQTALKLILKNPMWTGFPIETYEKISNIRHWHLSETEMTRLERTFSNPTFDFLPALTDLSEWSFDFSGNKDELKMRSLKWPGFTFYICNDRWANSYFGTGLAEVNVLEIITQKTAADRAHTTIQ
jgi:hypothetical protein